MSAFTGAILVSSLTFLFYGCLCLASSSMKSEFIRFGLPGLRTLTGVLEVMGGIGLLAGLYWPVCLLLASAGLFLLMLAAVGARLRIQDPLAACLPAIGLMLLNASIFIHSLRPHVGTRL